jgi:hypothetical protein
MGEASAAAMSRSKREIPPTIFLNSVAALHRRLGVEIPEPDYPKPRSFDAAAEHLEARLARP